MVLADDRWFAAGPFWDQRLPEVEVPGALLRSRIPAPPVLSRQRTLAGFWGLNGWAGSATGTDDVAIRGRLWHIIGRSPDNWRRIVTLRQLSTVPSGLLAEVRWWEDGEEVHVEWCAERPALLSAEEASVIGVECVVVESVVPMSGVYVDGGDSVCDLAVRVSRNRRVRRMRRRLVTPAFLNGNNGSWTNSDDVARLSAREVASYALVAAFACRAAYTLVWRGLIVGDDKERRRTRKAVLTMSTCSAITGVVQGECGVDVAAKVCAPICEEILPRLYGTDLMLYTDALVAAELFQACAAHGLSAIVMYAPNILLHYCLRLVPASLAVALHHGFNKAASSNAADPNHWSRNLASTASTRMLGLDAAMAAFIGVGVAGVSPPPSSSPSAGMASPPDVAETRRAVTRAQQSGFRDHGRVPAPPEGYAPKPRAKRGGRRKRKKKTASAAEPPATGSPEAGGEAGAPLAAAPQDPQGVEVPPEAPVEAVAQDVAPVVVLRLYQESLSLYDLLQVFCGRRGLTSPLDVDGSLAFARGWYTYSCHEFPVDVVSELRAATSGAKLHGSTVRQVQCTLQSLDAFKRLPYLRQESVNAALPAVMLQRHILLAMSNEKAGVGGGVPSGSLNAEAPECGTRGGSGSLILKALSVLTTSVMACSRGSIEPLEMPCGVDGSLSAIGATCGKATHRGIVLCTGLVVCTLGLSTLATARIWRWLRTVSFTTKSVLPLSTPGNELLPARPWFAIGVRVLRLAFGGYSTIKPFIGLIGVRSPLSGLM